MELNLVKLKMSIRTSNGAALRRWLTRAGEAYAETCKHQFCPFSGAQCPECSRSKTCDWQSVFGQRLSVDPEALRNHQKPPLPFVFTFPVPDAPDDGSGMMECGLVVVGRAITCCDMLLRGFSSLLKAEHHPARATLLHTVSLDYRKNCYPLGNGAGITHPENLVVMSAEDIIAGYPADCRALTVRLLSPLRLISQGRTVSYFDFSLFARSIMRRISSLAYYYGDYTFDSDYKALSNLAHAVRCLEARFSTIGNKRESTSGISGSGCFCGELGDLLPFLTLGTYLHVGKNASFGMGAYDLDFA